MWWQTSSAQLEASQGEGEQTLELVARVGLAVHDASSALRSAL
jgi:hypothetical protein